MADSAPVTSSLPMSSYDVRELSFQNVVDRILRPSGIKMGGFPAEMFTDLTEADQQKFMCNICYMMANESRCCDNKHVFCRSYILAWSMTFGENSQKCPFCRCNQTEYHVDKDLDDQLKEKRVQCPTEGCSYKAPLRFFLMHSHGRTNYSNADVDFNRIQSEQPRFFPLDSLAALEGDNVAAEAMDIREQLLQGRMMIHQMMMLMHLEMQLRQQALVSYQEAHEPEQRMQRLDDVMALNEQLNEVGSILGMLLNAPINHDAAVRTANTQSLPASQQSPRTVGGRFAAPATNQPGLGSLLPRIRFRVLDTDDDDDDDDDASLDEVTDDVLSCSASNAADDDDIFDVDFGRASSSSGNSYSVTSSAQTGIGVSTSGNDSVGYHSVASGSGPDRRHVSTTLTASNGISSSMLSRRHAQPPAPRWSTVDRTAVSVTVSELNAPSGGRSTARTGAMPPRTVTLPQIQSPTGQAPPTHGGENVRPSLAGRQASGSQSSTVSSSSTPRQLESVSRNRSSGSSNSPQTAASSHPAFSSATAGSVNTPQQQEPAEDSCQPSSVLTEPWPNLRTTEPHPSSSLYTSQSMPASRHNDSRLSQTRGGMVRNARAGATAALGPRRGMTDMHSNRAPLQLQRSSMRNTLSRPAGPASVSALRPAAPAGPRMVPLPHPPVRDAGRQQGLSGSRTQPSNDSLMRPRRRSEIAHEIMFPSHRDTEQ